MGSRSPMPLIGVTACAKTIGRWHIHHAVGEKYVVAVAEGAGALPSIIPPLGDFYDLPDLVARLDGLLVTGSPSNVAPHHYGGPLSEPGAKHDPRRDATSLPLVRAAISAGLPLLAICRGLQELNVALGGTLHQRVHEVSGKEVSGKEVSRKMDHREPKDAPPEVQYAPVHPVSLTPGGVLAEMFGVTELKVNSLHAQGIDRLADDLEVEATAPDGLVEAVRVRGARAFTLGVQWHPEWRFWESAESRALFAAFGDAAEARARERRRGAVPSKVA